MDSTNDWKNGQLTNINNDGHVQDAVNKLNQAKSNLESVKSTKAEDETKLQQAKDGLASLNQVLATKQSVLDNAEQKANASANQAVKDAQKKLDTINGKIVDLQNTIEATKTTISNAQAQLDKDNQKITDIKNSHKPAKSDSSETTDNTATKPTIVLPTTDKENSSAVSGAQGQYVNVISKDSVASQGSQAGIQAPTTPVTIWY